LFSATLGIRRTACQPYPRAPTADRSSAEDAQNSAQRCLIDPDPDAVGQVDLERYTNYGWRHLSRRNAHWQEVHPMACHLAVPDVATSAAGSVHVVPMSNQAMWK
jgi:hypothetical protein